MSLSDDILAKAGTNLITHKDRSPGLRNDLTPEQKEFRRRFLRAIHRRKRKPE